LRSIYAAQIQVQAGHQIDTNGDGQAEFGYLAELTGAVPARVTGPGNTPTAGTPGVDELDPSVLVAGLGAVQSGVTARSGYLFRIYLPGPSAGGAVPGISRTTRAARPPVRIPTVVNGSSFFCAYAWPILKGKSGNACFFINQEGQLLRSFTRSCPTPRSPPARRTTRPTRPPTTCRPDRHERIAGDRRQFLGPGALTVAQRSQSHQAAAAASASAATASQRPRARRSGA
jgi:hypothetical protein